MGGHMRRSVVLIVLVLGLVAALPASATAHPRGASAAKIAFVRGGDIWTIAEDGSQLLQS